MKRKLFLKSGSYLFYSPKDAKNNNFLDNNGLDVQDFIFKLFVAYKVPFIDINCVSPVTADCSATLTCVKTNINSLISNDPSNLLTVGSDGLFFVNAGGSTPPIPGSLTNFAAGNLSPLFTTTVANPTTSPVLSFTLTAQSANKVYASPNGVSGNPTFRKLVAADLPITFSGTTNFVAKFLSPSSIGDSQIYDNGTNVGIGTALPGFKLDLNGTFRTNNIVQLDGIPQATKSHILYFDDVTNQVSYDTTPANIQRYRVTATLIAGTPLTITHNLNASDPGFLVINIVTSAGECLDVFMDGVTPNSFRLTSADTFTNIKITILY